MYAITGATGNTGRLIVENLLAARQKVRAIARNRELLEPLVAKGADPVVCDLGNTSLIAEAFLGARAVYAMVPPDMGNPDYRAYQERIVESLATAVELARVPYVVTLSSVGADKKEGTGPIVGLHRLENRFNRIAGLNVLHLRAGYFMENTLAQAPIIQALNVAAGPLRPDLQFAMIATRDIADAATRALHSLAFQGHQTRELLGQRDLSMTEAAAIIGAAIGRPDLTYTQIPEPQVRESLVQAGMSPESAELLIEMANAMNLGHVRPLERRSPENTTPTSYETFVAERFVPLFRGRSAAS